MSDDHAAMDAFINSRGLGGGTAAGSKSYVIGRIGELINVGAEEVMLGGILTTDVEKFQQIDEDSLAAFD